MTARGLAPWLGYLAFVVYGSLVPLDFRPLPLEQAWRQFQATPWLTLGLEARADWIANGVLYLPLGALAMRALSGGSARWHTAPAVLAGLACLAVAAAVEFAQLAFPPRTVSLNDLMAEAIGSAIGIALAPMLGGRLDRLRDAWGRVGPAFTVRLLEAYALGYLALSFFPYDLLLSWQELRGKAASDAWGWLLAPDARGAVATFARLGAEAALALPLGALLAHADGGRRVGIGAAVLLGALFGVVIEAGQFLVASGVSQGASVIARAVGVAAGVALLRHLAAHGAGAARQIVRRTVWVGAPAYLALLLAVNGWFKSGWHGLAGAADTWNRTRLLPFYYHYYSSEATALFSLGSVALMYAPIALGGWALGWRRAPTVMAVALVALGVEAGKLFVPGRHPDPTNLLIACAAAWLLFAAVRLWERPAGAAAQAGMRGHDPAASTITWPWLLAVPAALAWAAQFPAHAVLLSGTLAACAVAVWWRPVLALAIVPAALPLLDLAPWSGRFFLDEFDLLMAVVIAVAIHRERSQPRIDERNAMVTLAFVVLAASLAISALRPLLPWPGLDADSFSGYTSNFNALRIVKGAVWAWAFVVMFRRLDRAGDERARLFGAGMLIGLCGVVLWIVAERAAFGHLFDFTADFRVSGPFSAMHKGGAYVECYLAVAGAFAAVWAIRTRHRWARVGGLLMLALTSYAVMVTYSRNGYAAFAVAVVGAALVGARRPMSRWRAIAAQAAVVLVAAASALPVLLGAYATERLSRIGADLAVRQAHWDDALGLRSPGWGSALFGEGLGGFPQAHFWRSREPVRAATVKLVEEAGRRFLRLGPGATLYIDQILPISAGGELDLTLDVRSRDGRTDLQVTLCRKWLLTSLDCGNAHTLPRTDARPGEWRTVALRLRAGDGTQAPVGAWPPWALSLLTPAAGVVDVDNVALRTLQGQSLLHNGGFERGLDRWFFTTDVDPPWHIHSLPLAVLFDQGGFGVLAWTLLVATALTIGGRLIRSGEAMLPAAWIAAVAFLTSATLNTLIDAPRFLWLLLVLLWLGTLRARCGVEPRAARPARAGPRGDRAIGTRAIDLPRHSVVGAQRRRDDTEPAHAAKG